MNHDDLANISHTELASLRQQLADANARAEKAESGQKEQFRLYCEETKKHNATSALLAKAKEDFEYAAQALTEHAEAVGVSPDRINYIDETTKAIISAWANKTSLEQANAALRAEVERLKAELETHLQSLAHFTEIHATKGGMDLHIQQHPVLREMIAKTFATMVLNSPNYTEMTFSVMAEPEKRITVTVKKAEGKTPHQLRIEAEQQRDAFKADADRLAGALVPILKGDCSFCALEEAHEALAAHAKLKEGGK